MPVREILRLGNPRLYEESLPVREEELPDLPELVSDLHDTLMDYRRQHKAGRAIAAPQIGVLKRIVYMHIEQPTVFVNPTLYGKSSKMVTLWDDCMCFPDLLVQVERHESCKIVYRDLDWKIQRQELHGSLSELLQHECDHLEGILAVARARDRHSFAYRDQIQDSTP